jgi:hypothetical protein
MKCQEFVPMARDLARHQIFGELCDVDVRTRALAHTAECPACAARLADERSLATGLRALATQDEPLAAPARVETALLTAFRQPRQMHGNAPDVVPLRPRAPRWVGAAAAVLLIGCLTLVSRWLLPSGSRASKLNIVAQTTPTVTPVANTEQKRFTLRPPEVAAAPVKAAPPKHIHAAHKRPSQRERIERYLVESEIATDFLPVVDTSMLAKPDRLRIIRVEVPRAALASFGLPMSFERATEPIQAELVVGSDGLTRAIRFIQNNHEPVQIISANNPSSTNEKER